MTCSSSRLFWLCFFVVAVLYVLFLFPGPEYCVYNKDDAGCFMTLGINLARYGRYTMDTFPAAEWGRHGTWPPVFPLLLAGVIRVFGLNWWALKGLLVLLALGNLLLLRRLLDAVLPHTQDRGVSRWTVILTGLSPTYFLFGHMTMSEIPFMFFCTATLLLIVRANSLGGAAGAGILAAIAFLTRGYAVVFLPAGVLCFLLRGGWPASRRWAAAVCFAVPLGLSIAGWAWYTDHVIQSGQMDGFTAHFGNLGQGSPIARPLGQYAREAYWFHSRSYFHLLFPFVSMRTALAIDVLAGVGATAALVGLLGWVQLVRRGEYAVSLWLAFSIGLLIAVGGQSPRYWLTYLPFIIFLTLGLLRDLSTRWHQVRWLWPLGTVVLLLSIGAGLAVHLANPDGLRFITPYWQEWPRAARWARESLPQDAVIVTHSPHNAYATFNLRACGGPPNGCNQWPVPQLASEKDVYVLGPTKFDDAELSKLQTRYRWLGGDGRFHVAYQGEHVRIWKAAPSRDGEERRAEIGGRRAESRGQRRSALQPTSAPRFCRRDLRHPTPGR